jgi:uncharacterized membrane protein YccC
LNWLRDLAKTVVSFDRSAFEPGYALRCTLGVAIPLAIAALLGKPELGVPAAIGAFITGFTSLQGIYRTRLTAMLAAAVGMSLTSFIGAVAAHSTAGIIAATALAGYLAGTLGQLGPAAATVSLNSLVAFVLFSSQRLSPAAAEEQSALVLAGGLIQAILLLVAWPTARLALERLALADVYRKLAAYSRGIANDPTAIPPIPPLATARQVLADPQPFTRAAEMARFRRLLEDAEVIRKLLGALAATAPVQAANAGDRLDAIADVLTGKNQRAAWLGGSDLDAHLRDALEAAAMLSDGRLPSFHLLSKPRPTPYVQNHIEWFGRDALRPAFVLAIAMALGRHFAADRGYWIPLTAALVLRPDFQTTFVRGFARIGGTLVGAVVASFVIALVRGNEALQLGGIVLTALAAYLTFNPNYALFTVAITSFVVMVLSMRGLPGTTTIDARVLDTLAGGALAMIGYVALPSWERKRTRPLLADLLDAQRKLADVILRAFPSPSADARKSIEAARSEVWKIRTAVEASIDRSRNEPNRSHTIEAGRALAILAATQRFALANLAFESALDSSQAAGLSERLTVFADALDATMAELAQALRESRRARLDEYLCQALAKIEAALATENDPERRFIFERLRAYGEATTRIARFVRAKGT